MNNKPMRKYTLKVVDVAKEDGFIIFAADAATTSQIQPYGKVWFENPHYRLDVNACYDFDDVLAFLETLETAPVTKPVKKQALVVTRTYPKDRHIFFYADDELLTTVKHYGKPLRLPAGGYIMVVDARFDFDDVLAWMNNLAKQQ